MPRISNTRPTSIYWLYDVRPTTLLDHPQGRPFYCGKTVKSTNRRLGHHRVESRKHPNRPVSVWLKDCGDYVRVSTMEVVPVEADWIAREQFWIYTIRTLYPGGANVADGGAGVPGVVRSDMAKAKTSIANKGRKLSEEHKAKLSAAKKGKPGKKHSIEVRAKMSASMLGKKKGRKLSAEHRASMSAAQKGRTISPEHRAKLRAAILRYYHGETQP